MQNQSTPDIAYFFGTFNPIHVGHLIMADAACDQFGFSHVVFIPAAVPPHRLEDQDLAPYCDRLEMTKRACATHQKFQVSDIESKLPSPSFTLKTLEALCPDFYLPNNLIPLLMGQDALSQLASWHGAQTLIEHCLFLQAPRVSGNAVYDITLHEKSYPLQTKMIDMPLINVSSSDIRKRIAKGRSIRYVTPAPVERYIAWNRLYQSTH